MEKTRTDLEREIQTNIKNIGDVVFTLKSLHDLLLAVDTKYKMSDALIKGESCQRAFYMVQESLFWTIQDINGKQRQLVNSYEELKKLEQI